MPTATETPGVTAEQALWARYRLEPTDRFVELDSPAALLRIREVGSGDPVLFVHGTGGPGTWPSLVSELEGLRCLMLDRPGWGLSSPVDFTAGDYNALVADLLSGVLDELGLDHVHVIGASIGNNWALRLADGWRRRFTVCSRDSDRPVRRVVSAGCPGARASVSVAQ